MTAKDAILQVNSIDVSYSTEKGPLPALRDVSIEVKQDEILGVAGESGSGKSTLALAILQYLGENGQITSGNVVFKGEDLTNFTKQELQTIRGKEIAHVPQDAKKSLNPTIKIGKQIAETIEKHQDVTASRAQEQAIEMLKQVDIADPEYNSKQYPHELSGGQQQRVLVAIALSCNPDLLILDEPTTGLDVTTEAEIIQQILQLREEYDTAIILITHDLGVIAEMTDRVAILYAGELMETGKTSTVFENPANPYTQGLLNATPELGTDKIPANISGQIKDLTELSEGCVFADRCAFRTEECVEQDIELETAAAGHETRCIRWEEALENPIQRTDERVVKRDRGEELLVAKGIKKFFDQPSSLQNRLEGTFLESYFDFEPPIGAVNGVDITIYESETVGLVGESGSGKSTFAQTVLKLLDPTDGTIEFKGTNITDSKRTSLVDFYSEVQIVFQNPHSSLNPKKTVSEILGRPLKLFTEMDKEERTARIKELLNQVDLGPEYMSRYPHELSGGENQRIAIARAFAPNPALIVLDEPVSALDVSVQAKILNLLNDLQTQYQTSYLLISHDLSVVNSICDRINVMYLGEIVEKGTRDEIFNLPHHPYTRVLLSSIPSLDVSKSSNPIRLEGPIPSPRDRPEGCSFHTRCPQKIGEVCENEDPPLEPRSKEESHTIACHLDECEMNRPMDE